MESKEDKIKRLEEAITKLDGKTNKIMFYLPAMPQASGGIGVVYEHVKTLVDAGYNAMVAHDTKDYPKPTWMGSEYTELPHLCLMEKPAVGPEDVLVIPEGFTNIMEQSKDLPCLRIVLCQSYIFVLGALLPGMSWADFGIKEVVVVTPTLQTYIEDIFGKNKFNFTVCRPSVNEAIFKAGVKPKQPIVAISSRDPQMTTNTIKHFYAKYPQFKWVTFRDMHNLNRTDFAEQLQDSCLGVWLDRVAGFGTFPIECAKTNTPFIGLVPDIIPEYASDKNGIWTNNIIQVPDLIANYFQLWFEDKEPQDLLDGLAELGKQYTKEDEIKNITDLYGNFLSVRKEEIKSVLEKIKTEENE